MISERELNEITQRIDQFRRMRSEAQLAEDAVLLKVADSLREAMGVILYLTWNEPAAAMDFTGPIKLLRDWEGGP